MKEPKIVSRSLPRREEVELEQPIREPEIQRVVNSIVARTERLEGCMDHLESRFSPVLIPVPASTANNSIGYSYVSPMGKSLESIEDRLMALAQRMEEMLENCAV